MVQAMLFPALPFAARPAARCPNLVAAVCGNAPGQGCSSTKHCVDHNSSGRPAKTDPRAGHRHQILGALPLFTSLSMSGSSKRGAASGPMSSSEPLAPASAPPPSTSPGFCFVYATASGPFRMQHCDVLSQAFDMAKLGVQQRTCCEHASSACAGSLNSQHQAAHLQACTPAGCRVPLPLPLQVLAVCVLQGILRHCIVLPAQGQSHTSAPRLQRLLKCSGAQMHRMQTELLCKDDSLSCQS
jgi:hypothetical protein